VEKLLRDSWLGTARAEGKEEKGDSEDYTEKKEMVRGVAVHFVQGYAISIGELSSERIARAESSVECHFERPSFLVKSDRVSNNAENPSCPSDPPKNRNGAAGRLANRASIIQRESATTSADRVSGSVGFPAYGRGRGRPREYSCGPVPGQIADRNRSRMRGLVKVAKLPRARRSERERPDSPFPSLVFVEGATGIRQKTHRSATGHSNASL